MPQKIISLSSKEELDIYMSPQRQRLLRTMRIAGKPVTAKALADKLGVSASSAAHHISKLVQLGVVEEDHTESVNGILAHYFRLADVTVNIGSQKEDGLDGERNAIMQNILLNTLKGLGKGVEHALKTGIPQERLADHGDFSSGVIYLKPEDSSELMRLIREYINNHEQYKDGTQPWEFALILYNSEFAQ